MEASMRYSVIADKNPREIALLRGYGCKWKRCTFCDYHLDASSDEEENFQINKEALSHVTGVYCRLEVINSGSFFELDEQTIALIFSICKQKKISDFYTEIHWIYKEKIPSLRKKFSENGITLHVKTGVESFDFDFRETVLNKGISEKNPAKIAENFDECCLLFGITGQTEQTMQNDIETGLRFFDRICINLMVENSTAIKPDHAVIAAFVQKLYPKYQDNPNVDILRNNTDFGVGE